MINGNGKLPLLKDGIIMILINFLAFIYYIKNERKEINVWNGLIKKRWLNPDDSPSTGNMVMFDGEEYDEDGKEYNSRFDNSETAQTGF